MLDLEIPDSELINSETYKIVKVKGQTIKLEHSLVSLSKWESKYHKPFLVNSKNESRTKEETIDYIRFMTITQNVDPNLYLCLREEHFKKIDGYIHDPHTATTITEAEVEGKTKSSSKIITSEVIYSRMIELGIPSEYQKWHLNRLLMLIRVCDLRQKPPKKMNKRTAAKQRHAANEARKARLHSNG